MSYTGDASSLGRPDPISSAKRWRRMRNPRLRAANRAPRIAHGTVLLGGLEALGFEGSIEARVDASGVQLEYLALVGLG